MFTVAVVPRNGGTPAENRERAGAITGARFVADGSRGAVDDHSRRGADHGVDLGAGSRGCEAFFLDQESHQLLWVVRGREEFRQHGPTHAAVKTTQQTFADDAERSSKDGAAQQPGAGHAL